VSAGDPVSWLMIEPGWKVVDMNGHEIGSVDEIVGDSSDDIFNGLSISTSFLGTPRYVASEQVGTIVEGSVRLKLSKEQIGRLDEFKQPPTTAEILPEEAGLLTRAEAAAEAPIRSHPQRMGVVARLWYALKRALRR
jgi:hypothetical protein